MLVYLERGKLLILPAEHGQDVGVEAGAGLVRSAEAGEAGPGLARGHWRLTSDLTGHWDQGGWTLDSLTHCWAPRGLSLYISHWRLDGRGHGSGGGQARLLLVRPLSQ